jgi:hypothetical protein
MNIFLKAVAQIDNNSSLDDIKNTITKLWNENPGMTMKTIFFLLDPVHGKGQSCAFARAMKCVYDLNQTAFYRNLSLVIGVPNDLAFSWTDRQQLVQTMFESKYNEYLQMLETNVDPTYHQPFLKSFVELQFEELELPCYGSFEDLLLVHDYVRTQKCALTIVGLMIRQNLTLTQCYKLLEPYSVKPYYDGFINYITESIKSSSIQTIKKPGVKPPPVTTNTDFKNRYLFIK